MNRRAEACEKPRKRYGEADDETGERGLGAPIARLAAWEGAVGVVHGKPDLGEPPRPDLWIYGVVWCRRSDMVDAIEPGAIFTVMLEDGSLVQRSWEWVQEAPSPPDVIGMVRGDRIPFVCLEPDDPGPT